MKKSFNKLRGGYYTPPEVTRFITEWAIRNSADTVLEPSCGDGHFLNAAKERFLELGVAKSEIRENILGVELYDQEVKKAKKYGTTVVCDDFFCFYKRNIKDKKKFQVVIGNPPFIRYQNFDETFRERAFDLVSEIGVKLTKLSNIWLPFLILSCECLDQEKGRLGMVIPAELFQVDYAKETRKYLTEKFDHLMIITFKELLFEGAQQDVVLLLGECNSKRKGIEVIELENADSLENFNLDCSNSEVKELDHSVDKWTKYFLTNKELEVLRRIEMHEGLVSTQTLFDVNVGVVSGQNDFFVIDKQTIEHEGLEGSVTPIIGRAEQLKGICLSDKDLQELQDENRKVFLFTPNRDKLTSADEAYIAYGEEQDYHKGYKCRIRNEWYIVPQSWNPEAFMLRQINKYPKIVINKTGATNTDTLHKIRFHQAVKGETVATAFINSFTLAQSEITGRSYGGGVMTFEPGEVRKLSIPMKGAEKLDVEYIDELMRRKEIHKILDYTDEILLIEGLGLSREDTDTLRGIWEKLSNRRINRRKNRLKD